VRKRRGFTLIELLLSLAIMSAVLVLSATAYQMYTDTWRRDLSQIETSFDQFQQQDLMLNAIQAIIPLSVKKDKKLNSTWGFYFLGRQQGFTAITASPIFFSGYPAVIRLFSESMPNGGFQLVYEEASLKGMVLKQADQTLPFQHRLVIRGSLPHIAFRFFGWPSLDAKMASIAENQTDAAKGMPQWFDDYDGLTRNYQPDKIEMVLGSELLTINLPNRTVLGLKRGNSEESI
jgi:prepilin-type N-terminal cleavage/methylation domain-containing protein